MSKMPTLPFSKKETSIYVQKPILLSDPRNFIGNGGKKERREMDRGTRTRLTRKKTDISRSDKVLKAKAKNKTEPEKRSR